MDDEKRLNQNEMQDVSGGVTVAPMLDICEHYQCRHCGAVGINRGYTEIDGQRSWLGVDVPHAPDCLLGSHPGFKMTILRDKCYHCKHMGTSGKCVL